VSGALAERVFARKMLNVGLRDVEVVERRPFGLTDVARYPLFTPDLIELMRRLLRAEQRAQVAVAVTMSAVRPETAA
jgi:hypothetical protein